MISYYERKMKNYIKTFFVLDEKIEEKNQILFVKRIKLFNRDTFDNQNVNYLNKQ